MANEAPKITPTTVRVIDGTETKNVTVDLTTASDQELLFLWEVSHNEAARVELKNRNGIDPATPLSALKQEDFEFFNEWAKNNPEKVSELDAKLNEYFTAEETN